MGADEQEAYQNFFSAYTGENGITGVKTYNTVQYKNIYPHIDMVLHTKDNGVKYEFVVHPGGNVADIKVRWDGAKNMAMLADGGIRYTTQLGEMTETAPVSFLSNGAGVSSHFVKNSNITTFSVGDYDQTQTLTIDPGLTWGTYLGGTTTDWSQAVWADNLGNIIMTGPTYGGTAMGTSGAFLTSYSGGSSDAWVAKFSPKGVLLWSTYYGGSGYNDGWALGTDKYNNIIMTGTTSSSSGISTSGGYQSVYGQTGSATYNAYFVKFTPNGGRLWATYFGYTGADQGLYIALDNSYNIYLTCWITSSSGIATSGAYQTSFGGGGQDASLEKYDSTGKLLWSTYFGGSGLETGTAVAVDYNGNAIITGYTPSTSGIASSGAYQTSFGGSQDVYVASFSASGNLNWATYLGGSGNDYGWGVFTDPIGNVFVSGQTGSNSGVASYVPYQAKLFGTTNVFLAKFSQLGVLAWSTYYGGGGTDISFNVATDLAGTPWVSGSTTSTSSFATTGAYQTSNGGSSDAFVARFSPAGTLMYSTYYGGSGADIAYDAFPDNKGNVYLTGNTASTSGIATSGAYQTTFAGVTDAFLAGVSIPNYYEITDAGIAAIQTPSASFCTDGVTKVQVKVLLENFGRKDLTGVTIGWSVNHVVQTPYTWSGTLKWNATTSVTLGSLVFNAGVDTVIAWTTKPNSLVDSIPLDDTARYGLLVYAFPKPNAGGKKIVCAGTTTTVGTPAVTGHAYSWTSKPAGFTSTSAQPTVSPTVTTTYYLTETITAGGCSASDSVVVTVAPIPKPNAGGPQTVCFGGSAKIGMTAITGHVYTWSSVPSGFTSTSSNPTVNPTVRTTYYMSETDTASGCYAYDNATINVNAPVKANAGGNHAVCLGASVTLGGAPTTGHTYSWASKPSGYTNTTSGPTVKPTATTNYILTETVTASGCLELDSALITINPLPVPNAGGNHAICDGGNVAIGSTAVTGHTYSWTSTPSGFTNTTSKPTVNPTATTTYYMTEKITATGCSKIDSAIVTVNPLPKATTGLDTSICLGYSFSIGDVTSTGHTYAWTSKPKGFTSTGSNPTVSPTATTTYFLTETIKATGCTKSDSVIIKVNTITAHAGGNHTICAGNNLTLGQTSVLHHYYSWTSTPSGFSSAISDPKVNPTSSITYYLTEADSTTGCTKTDSSVVSVNPVPNAKTGGNQKICAGKNITLGDVSVTGNSYAWTSKPFGFTSAISNPVVNPTVTTTYYLTEFINKTGCLKEDSAKITVNQPPTASWSSLYTHDTTVFKAVDSLLPDASYRWKFGDGDSSIGHVTGHVYPKNKAYKVQLFITGTNGCIGELDSNLNVKFSGIEGPSTLLSDLKVYPNPFHTSTILQYNLETRQHVVIGLYDVAGKQIGTIMDATQESGTYNMDIHAEKYNLEPGIYLLKFTTGNGTVSRQVIRY